MLYDYGGFPSECYKYKYGAPGNPRMAQRIQTMLADAGIPARLDPQRGFDHGVFVPLMMSFPAGDIPVLSVSLHRSLDPALHLRIGEVLSPLRSERVLFIGSGSSFHNMQALMGGRGGVPSKTFDDFLLTCLTKETAEKRREQLINWKEAPGGAVAHPREEHLIPLHCVVGAAGENGTGTRIFSGVMMGSHVSSFIFEG